MIRNLLMILSLQTLLISVSFAASALTNLLNSVRTMQADFQQITLDNHGKVIQQSKGKMSLQRPGKFRWEIKKPMPQLIVANQSRLWVFDPDLDQVLIRSLDKAAGQTPAVLLSNENTTLDNDFNIKDIKGKNSEQLFQLTPKKPETMYSTIQIKFNGNEISEMRLADQLGHTTKIIFNNIKTNLNLPSSLFTFSPPAHVDVIDETHKK